MLLNELTNNIKTPSLPDAGRKNIDDLVKKQDDGFTSMLDESGNDLDIEKEVDKFVKWASKRVNLQKPVKVNLNYDTEEAQDNHHTGMHIAGSNEIWVYAKNRNLVDILRTVFHEIVHVRQGELNMIQPGDSYPGSPIEAMADLLAGKYIKIWGEKHHYIFQ